MFYSYKFPFYVFLYISSWLQHPCISRVIFMLKLPIVFASFQWRYLVSNEKGGLWKLKWEGKKDEYSSQLFCCSEHISKIRENLQHSNWNLYSIDIISVIPHNLSIWLFLPFKKHGNFTATRKIPHWKLIQLELLIKKKIKTGACFWNTG
jgi:hypothetical protein